MPFCFPRVIRALKFLIPFVWALPVFWPAQSNAQAQNKRLTDSIFAYIRTLPDDTAKVVYINKIYDDTLWMFNLPEAYNQLKIAAKLSKKLKFDRGEYKSYANMAGYCTRSGVNDYSIQNRRLAMEVALRMHDSTKVISQWVGIGLAYHSMLQYDSALLYYYKAKPYYETENDPDKLGRLYTFMAWTYEGYRNDSVALIYARKAMDVRRKMGYYQGMIASGNTLRGIYNRMGERDSSRMILAELLHLHEGNGNTGAVEETKIAFGELKEAEGDLDSAYWYYNACRLYAENTNNAGLKVSSYAHLSSVLEKMNRKAEAFEYLKLYKHLNDSIIKWEQQNNLARAKEIYDVESKNQEIEILSQQGELAEKELQDKENQRYWLLAMLLMVTLVVIFVFRAYRLKRKSADELRIRNLIIEEKNHDITDSIQYAKRIQTAILPSLLQIKAALPESFVYFSPKDIVSGDFFWFNETASSYYVAAVDCTGHGVPGAMMSMIGYNFLGQIVNEKDIEQPAEILNELHRKVLMALNKDYTTREVKDGMDVALIRIDKQSKKISFCGAVRPVYLVKDGVLTEIKGDIYSVGGIKDANSESFTQHELDLQPGTSIYLFSDGYADQFGGPNGKKFKYKQLRALFTRVSSLPIEQQRSEIEKAFTSWRAELEQVDDVCVVGLRMS